MYVNIIAEETPLIKSNTILKIYNCNNENNTINELGSTDLKDKTSLYSLLRRPEITLNSFRRWIDLSDYDFEVQEIGFKSNDCMKESKSVKTSPSSLMLSSIAAIVSSLA